MTSEKSPEKLEAIQAVVDRVSSWQETATEGTVAEELRKGADEVGVLLTDDEITRLTDAIEAHQGQGNVDAGSVLA